MLPVDAVRVQAADFDVAAEYAALRAADATGTGAIAQFTGLVRDSGDVDGVGEMFLEHYPGMTEQALAVIIDEARARWPLAAVRIVHRVGTLKPSDQIVFVGVASAHRAAAFAACEFLMDYLKTRAPFWKRETDAAGVARWVEQKASDLSREARWRESPVEGVAAPAGSPQGSGTRRG